jgi:hypothetical protein
MEQAICLVVFRCDGRWDDYEQFTAAPTLPANLDFADDVQILDPAR